MSQRLAFRISSILALVYVASVAVGFAALKFKWTLPIKINEVSEFLLVLAAVAVFVWGLALTELSEQPKKTLWQIFDDNFERYAMLIAYAFVCVVIVQEVLRRYVLNYSSAWSQETAQYLFIYLGYIGAAYAVKERAHIRFDVLLNRVSPRVRTLLYIVGEICTLFFAVIAIYWTLHTVAQLLKFGGTTPVLRINKAWFEMAVPIGFFLIVFRCLQALKRDVADLRSGRPAFAGKAMFEE